MSKPALDKLTILACGRNRRPMIAAIYAGIAGGWDCAITSAHQTADALKQDCPPASEIRQQLRHLGIPRTHQGPPTYHMHSRIIDDAVSHALGEEATA